MRKERIIIELRVKQRVSKLTTTKWDYNITFLLIINIELPLWAAKFTISLRKSFGANFSRSFNKGNNHVMLLFVQSPFARQSSRPIRFTRGYMAPQNQLLIFILIKQRQLMYHINPQFKLLTKFINLPLNTKHPGHGTNLNM